MDTAINLVEARIKELKDLVSRTPIQKSFTVQSRLIEAQHILKILLDSKIKPD